MLPADYALEIIVPIVREFRDDRRSRRRAFLACIVTYHLKDYLEKSGADVEAAMKMFGRATCFEVVRAVCNGTKHRGWRASHAENIQFVPGDDYDRPPCVAGLAVCDLSRVGDIYGGREVAQNLGGIDIYRAVKTCLREYYFHFHELLDEVDFREC
jgi:hypothetical protein